MRDVVVSKAGGTSHATPEAFELSLEWAEESTVMVVSAPGKIDNSLYGSKVTKQLLAGYDGEVPLDTVTDAVTRRFIDLTQGLGVTMPQGWHEWIAPRIEAYMDFDRFTSTTIGELLTAEVYEQRGYRLIDPASASADLGTNPDAWHEFLNSEVDPKKDKIVIPGNRTRVNGSLRSLEEGGSDYAAGLAAYALQASVHYNLTDGPARSADPKRIEDESRLEIIEHLTYEELRELGLNGTGLVHPGAALPLSKGNIPTLVRSTFDRALPATTLDNDFERAATRTGRAMALSVMEDVVVVNVHEPGIASKQGPLAHYEDALSKAEIPIIDTKGNGADFQRYFFNAQHAGIAHDILRGIVEPNGGTVEAWDPKNVITIVGYLLERSILDQKLRFATNAGLQTTDWQKDNDMSDGKHMLRVTVDKEDTNNVFNNLHRAFIEAA